MELCFNMSRLKSGIIRIHVQERRMRHTKLTAELAALKRVPKLLYFVPHVAVPDQRILVRTSFGASTICLPQTGGSMHAAIADSLSHQGISFVHHGQKVTTSSAPEYCNGVIVGTLIGLDDPLTQQEQHEHLTKLISELTKT